MYIDPGSGSMLIQVLVASVIGSVIAFRNAIFRFITGFKSSRQPPEGGAD